MDAFDVLYLIAGILLLPVIIYSVLVSSRVNRTFRDYSQIFARSGMTGYEVTRKMLKYANLNDVKIDRVRGNLTDHYDPRNNTIYLSDSVFSSNSVAAIGVAAHETGHAIQHNQNYVPVKVRSLLVPVVSIGSRFSIPLIFMGFILGVGSAFGLYIVYIGIAFYALSTIFMLVTLPVEFNASSRAKNLLLEMKILNEEEAHQASRVLNAAAKTYVASFAVSLLFLIRMLGLFGRRR
ncbi:MAG: zinc metallopeptidase [Bacillota bacterium]